MTVVFFKAVTVLTKNPDGSSWTGGVSLQGGDSRKLYRAGEASSCREQGGAGSS